MHSNILKDLPVSPAMQATNLAGSLHPTGTLNGGQPNRDLEHVKFERLRQAALTAFGQAQTVICAPGRLYWCKIRIS